MVNVAMIGFGGIGKGAHLNPYLQLEKEGRVCLKAICDKRPGCFEQKADINIETDDSALKESVHRYTDWREMLAKEQVDMVDICLPTYLHAEVTCEALKTGHHVLCEKPMSLSYGDCLKMIRAAEDNSRQLMIAQCLRFGSAYQYLKKIADENTYGKVQAGTFRRMSGPPLWGEDNWFCDFNRSHGCVLDMHIHDLDIIRHIFGEPKSASCITKDFYTGKDIAHTTLRYDDFSMLVIGDWSLEGMPFQADYMVSFERATVALQGGTVTVYPRNGEAFVPELEAGNFYFNEIAYFVDLIDQGKENLLNPPESAARSVKLAELLIESSEQKGDFLPFEA